MDQHEPTNSGNSVVNTASVSTAYALSKTASTPNALNIASTSNTGSSLVTKRSTPSLAQIGKQTSVTFRHSLLSDSGAESGDADDQTRLIRTPSIRSHKFIIIPSTPPGGLPTGASAPFRSTMSTSSLASLAAKLNASANQQQQQHAQQATREIRSQLSSTSTDVDAVVTASSSKSISQPSVNWINSPFVSPASLSQSHSDVNYQMHTEAAGYHDYNYYMPSRSQNATTVKFTIEDYDSDHAGTAATISRINSTTNFTPTSSPTAAGLIAATMPATSANLLYVPGCVDTSVGLRQSKERNSSMRSIASAFSPSYDPNQDPNYPFYQPTQPASSLCGKELLSVSSYIYHDPSGSQIYSDVTSVRSLASIGVGSTDGRKLVIRRVPTTANELFSLVHPPSPPPPGIDDDDDSFMDMSDELKPRQQHWANKMQFVLACIGYSVGLGNVWRFPYMCYKSGGGVFLVPYCIILIVCSIPLLFMELSVGQYTGRGPIGALGQLCPLFKGAGLASVVVSFLMSTYYSVIIGYSIYYFFTSFRPYMPWTDCLNRWNTPNCWVPQRNMTAPNTSRTPSEEFFENKVLQISKGIEFPGMMRWELFTCLICAWVLVYFATWKSIKSSAKVRYFTATFPFILIIILLGRAVTLEGAQDGLRYFFRPDWSQLKHANVWINAASQNFNSLGISFGSMISFASYNKYNNNILRDTISVSLVNVITSLLVGIFAFATLGNLALEQNAPVKDVIGDGPGLIFVVYPQAMAKMPYAQLWAVMFFFMLLCLGLNSQFAIVEVVVTSIQDGFPNWIKKHLGYHEVVVLIVCVISFLFGLPNMIQGGIYYFQLMDHYAASVSIMFLAFCQMIAIAWFYGTGRLAKNIKQMTGKAPSIYLKSCWVLFGPCLLFAIWILSLINYKEPTYHNGRYTYPDWAYGIGWMFASLSLVCIPSYALVNLLRSEGDFWQRVRNTLRPNIYECKICGEHHCEHDYAEQEQYMLTQEMAQIYKPSGPPSTIMQFVPTQKSGYSAMHLQQQQQQQQYNYEKAQETHTPNTTAATTR